MWGKIQIITVSGLWETSGKSQFLFIVLLLGYVDSAPQITAQIFLDLHNGA